MKRGASLGEGSRPTPRKPWILLRVGERAILWFASDGQPSNVRLLNRNNQEPNKIDSVWLRKLALNFQKKISRNAELRAKFEDIPEK